MYAQCTHSTTLLIIRIHSQLHFHMITLYLHVFYVNQITCKVAWFIMYQRRGHDKNIAQATIKKQHCQFEKEWRPYAKQFS